MRGEFRRVRALLVAAVALASAGCHAWYDDVPSPDDLMHNVPWFDHMLYSRAVHPYATAEIPRYAVLGTVPVTGSEGDWSGEWAQGKTATADKLVNPTTGGTAPSREVGPEVALIPADLAAKGDTLYQNYCSACHGNLGAGDGLVGRKLGAPAITTDRARAYTDGYLYSIIKYGRGVMPKYGDKIYSASDRWAVVNHVRKLQSAAPVTAASGGMN